MLLWVWILDLAFGGFTLGLVEGPTYCILLVGNFNLFLLIFQQSLATHGHFTHEPRAVTMKIVRAQKRVSKGRPNTPPKSCSVVMEPQV